MAQTQTDLPASGQSTAHQPVVRPRIVEKASEFTCFIALMVMLAVIVTDIITRTVINFSFEISDEIGGYMLVVMMFCSLSICHVNDCFHRVELVLGHLSARGRIVALIAFDLIALWFSIVLTWQFIRLEINSVRSGEDAGTFLMTPLWLPRIALAVGTAALCISLCRTILARARILLGQSNAEVAR